ncbi:hypothetical protein HMPREF9005_1976 [Actinomyces sp. oral taxon 178 str. F0338]|nr:hypothetical protein HMPREF9005_1976 [Actinomyces sp. oral taxon 178 str. F0338]
MALDPIVPQPGNDRNPAHFVGRAKTTTQARRRLKAGANLLLTDPRRMGKTFWMRAFAAREKGFHCYSINYEGVFTVNDFLIGTAKQLIKDGKLSQKARVKLRTIFNNCDIELPGPITIKSYHRQTSPHVLLTDVLGALDEDAAGVIPLVMMDEVPMAVNNIADREGPSAAAEILQTLRALRQRTANVRWIITGSIGFHHVLRRAGMTQGALNDLEPLPLGPLRDDEARELARRLLLGIGRLPDDAVVEALVEVSGGIPFLLHKVAATLDQRHRNVIRPAEVRECFEDFIDDPDEFGWFEHYLTRVGPHYRERADLAERVLRATLSEANDWIPVGALPPDDGVDDILEDLTKDHYLERRGQSIRWRYPVLQYIWARKKAGWDRR